MSNFFNVAHAHSKPSNKNAAMAVSGGLNYSPSHKDHEDFDLPPPYFLKHELPAFFGKNRACIESAGSVYGRKVFRLTALGLAKEKTGKKPLYVCKCSCGMFCLRTAQRITHAQFPCCGVCRATHNRKTREYCASTGVGISDAEMWQRMGGA